jgi:hypothetical protein
VDGWWAERGAGRKQYKEKIGHGNMAVLIDVRPDQPRQRMYKNIQWEWRRTNTTNARRTTALKAMLFYPRGSTEVAIGRRVSDVLQAMLIQHWAPDLIHRRELAFRCTHTCPDMERHGVTAPVGLAAGGRRWRKATDRGPTTARGFVCSTATRPIIKKRPSDRGNNRTHTDHLRLSQFTRPPVDV